MTRPCLEYGCPYVAVRGGARCVHHTRERNRVRNASPSRRALYDSAWAKHSRVRRAEEGGCMVVGCMSMDLTVDHPTDDVLCRSHHSQREAERRAARRASA